MQYSVEAPERVKKRKKSSGWFSSWFSSSDDEEDIEVETESKGKGLFFMGCAFVVTQTGLSRPRLCILYSV